jgi:hypothetical protein
VLAGMHEDLRVILSQLARDRGAPDKLGPGTDNGNDLHQDSCSISLTLSINWIIPLSSAGPGILPGQNAGHS